MTSISIPEALMGRGWADIYIVKGVSDALVLTIRELRKLICQSRTKQQETSHGCIVYSPYWLRLHFASVAKKGYLYTYTYVGLSALYLPWYIARPQFLFVTYLIISRYTKTQT